LFAPPREQPQAFLLIADFVAEIVGPTAERVYVVKILVQPFGKQEADDVEVFVVVCSEPARIPERFLFSPRSSEVRSSQEFRRLKKNLLH